MRAFPQPKHIVLDDFLPEPLLDRLDDHARRSTERLVELEAGGSPTESHYSALRKMWHLEDGLADLEAPFADALLDHGPQLCAGTGITPFDVARVETKVCVQAEGSFFAKHIDTDTDEVREANASDRVISAVYYFPREPLAFEGGELILYDFTGREESARVAPRRNRLVAFPSFACHAVSPVRSRSIDFADARWSISCWLHRTRSDAR